MTLLAYHGTEHEFSQFEIGLHHGVVSDRPSGYIFLSSSHYAAEYYGDRVLTVEVTMHNPLVITEVPPFNTIKGCADDAVVSNFKGKTDYDGVIVRDVIDGDTRADVIIIWDVEQLQIVG